MKMKIHDLPIHRQPREKMSEKGVEALSVPELLAVLLRTGYKGKSALEVAQRLCRHYSLTQLRSLPLAKLASIKGIGPSRAAQLQAAFEIGSLVDQKDEIPTLNTPQQVYHICHHLVAMKKEHLVALYLNARHQLLGQVLISVGTISSSLVHPREVFAPALDHRASALILVHNHPSGDASPSEEDILSTEKLVEAGEILDVKLIDHIIVSSQGWRSLRQDQLI
jgi:DNA repair protein RadC